MQLATSEECFDLSFTEESPSYFYLILELYPGEARAMWYHITRKLVTGFATYPYDGSLTNLIQSNKRLGLAYKEVLLTIRSSNYLLYPNILGDSIDEEAFMLTNDLHDEESLHQHALVNLKAQVIYPLTEQFDQESHVTLQHFKLIPHIAPSIEMEVNTLQKKDLKDAVWLFTYLDHLDLRVYQDGKLKLANSFFQSGKEDVAYFVLYAAEILKIDTKSIPIYIGGDCVPEDGTWSLLSDYWKVMHTSPTMDSITYSGALPTEKRGPYRHLTSSLLCAS